MPVEGASGATGAGSLLSPNTGVMVWTLLIFLLVWFILAKFAFPRITDAVIESLRKHEAVEYADLPAGKHPA